jgi:biotin synthase
MKMFEMLGLSPQNHLLKFPSNSVEAANSNTSLGEKPKWSRPGHTMRKPEASGKRK